MSVLLADLVAGNLDRFDIGDGSSTAFQYSKIANAILDGNTPEIHQADWQGVKKLLASARTNLIPNPLFAGGAAAPTSWSQSVATGTSAPVASTTGGPGVAYRQVAVAQRPYISPSSAIAVAANTTYTLSFIVEEVTDGLTALGVANITAGPAGSTVTFPICQANPSGGSGGVLTTGVMLVRLTTTGTAGTCVTRVGIGVSAFSTGTFQFSHPQFNTGTDRNAFINAAATVTDYTLSAAGALATPAAPAAGVVLARKLFDQIGKML